ncbi:MAG: hypothetical protein AAFO98_05405 [Pseudomonadota bacterium]
MPTDQLPPLALSVRQPWAWAIIHGGKVIENRTLGAIRSGNMDCRTICIHAATGMREKEYRWAVWKLQQIDVTLPRPDELIRGGIIGTVDVVDIVIKETCPKSHTSWFGGPYGLVLENPQSVQPIPAIGALGYFKWEKAGSLTKPSAWMKRFDVTNGDANTLDLFPDLQPRFKTAPDKPFGKKPKER